MKAYLSGIKTNMAISFFLKKILRKEIESGCTHEEKWEPCKGNRPIDEDISKAVFLFLLPLLNFSNVKLSGITKQQCFGSVLSELATT